MYNNNLSLKPINMMVCTRNYEKTLEAYVQQFEYNIRNRESACFLRSIYTHKKKERKFILNLQVLKLLPTTNKK